MFAKLIVWKEFHQAKHSYRSKVNRILKFTGCLGGAAILSEVTLNGATISRESRDETALFKYAACHHRWRTQNITTRAR